MTDDPLLAARRTALDIQARREHSWHELLEKLRERLPELDEYEVLRPALDQLVSDGMQSDQRFVEAYVRYRSTRGDGPLKIAAGLQPRRIAADLLKQALYENGPDWVQVCFEAMEKKFRQIGTAKPDQLQRVQRFLLQRGFTGEQVRAAIRLNRKD